MPRLHQGRVLGFAGLAATAMHHRFEVDGRALSTWCVWDSLFLPEILGRPARVSSVDPESGEIVRLVVTPERIVSVGPNGTLISFIRPDAQVFGTSAANVMAKFCHFIFFFASRSSGERWVDKNPGTFLYSLDDAFALAKRLMPTILDLNWLVESRSSPLAREMLGRELVALT
jgi:alkylmercury lyase